MKAAILSCFHPYRGGIAQFNANLYRELGLSCEVRAFNFIRQYPDILFPGKTQYVTDKDEAFKVESEAVLDSINPASWITAARKIARWKPDILIMRYWMPFFAPCLGYVAGKMPPDCKVIAVVDNAIPHERRPFDTVLTKYFLKNIDGAVTLCGEVAQDLSALNPGLKCLVSYHPLYSHFGEKLGREEAENILGLEHGRKNILFFGLIREYKGLDILLEAFDALPDDFQLIIAGEPYGSFEKYEALIERNRGRDRIKLFPEYVRDSEVKKYFSAADVTVLPYRNATQSGVSSVSYHFEVPMIVTDVGGLRETIGDRGTGLVASAVSAEAIREEIIRFFSDPSIRRNCIGNIRKEKENLSWSRFCSNLIDFSTTL